MISGSILETSATPESLRLTREVNRLLPEGDFFCPLFCVIIFFLILLHGVVEEGCLPFVGA